VLLKSRQHTQQYDNYCYYLVNPLLGLLRGKITVLIGNLPVVLRIEYIIYTYSVCSLKTILRTCDIMGLHVVFLIHALLLHVEWR
jgi:hypothetical protein